MERVKNFTENFDFVQYEGSENSTSNTSDSVEQVDANVQTDCDTKSNIFSVEKQETSLRKRMCIGIITAVITLLLTALAVTVCFILSTKPHDRYVQWEQGDETPVYEFVSCGIPNIPDHASIANHTGIPNKSEVFMKCDQGFMMHGDPVLKCMSNGTWTETPTCKPIDSKHISVREWIAEDQKNLLGCWRCTGRDRVQSQLTLDATTGVTVCMVKMRTNQTCY